MTPLRRLVIYDCDRWLCEFLLFLTLLSVPHIRKRNSSTSCKKELCVCRSKGHCFPLTRGFLQICCVSNCVPCNRVLKISFQVPCNMSLIKSCATKINKEHATLLPYKCTEHMLVRVAVHLCPNLNLFLFYNKYTDIPTHYP